MPPEAADEIATLVDTRGGDCMGYWINRRLMFMGGWLRHAYYPNWNLRLFRHRLGRFEQLVQGATQSGDNEVHEHILVQGRTGRMRCEMDHYAFPSIESFVEKHNRYSNWEARLAVEDGLKGNDSRLQASAVDLRRRLKRWSRSFPFRPALRFAYVYIIQRGFLDGARGYFFARLHGTYEFLSVAKTAELRWRMASVPNAPRQPSAPRYGRISGARPWTTRDASDTGGGNP
jgi:hypothetical protein